jgi:hypothetical protein
MRYAQRGGDAPAEQRRERLRLQAAGRFAARLQDAVDLDSARDDLAAVVYRALEPAHVSVWIRQQS